MIISKQIASQFVLLLHDIPKMKKEKLTKTLLFKELQLGMWWKLCMEHVFERTISARPTECNRKAWQERIFWCVKIHSSRNRSLFEGHIIHIKQYFLLFRQFFPVITTKKVTTCAFACHERVWHPKVFFFVKILTSFSLKLLLFYCQIVIELCRPLALGAASQPAGKRLQIQRLMHWSRPTN